MENTPLSLVEVITQLKAEGYTEDFNLQQTCIACRDGQFKILHDEFQVDKVFRFEGDTDPADESILYAISSKKHQLKGILVNAYGVYSEPLAAEMIAALRIH